MSPLATPAGTVERAGEQLATRLGPRLAALILFGSAVRGELTRSVSDINLLIVLQDSSPEDHRTIRSVLAEHPRIEPLIVALADLPRSFVVFAAKFQSIKRDYRVLAGSDVLAALSIDTETDRFLTEQGLRNLQLRLTHAYVSFGRRRRRYSAYLLRIKPALFVNLSEVLRLHGTQLPREFPARLPQLQAAYGPDVAVLAELLELKHNPHRLTHEQIDSVHARLLALLARALELLP